MNAEQNVVIETAEMDEMVQDYMVDVELSMVLRGHKQVAQYINADDFSFNHDQREDVHSIYIELADGTKIRKELFDVHVVSDGEKDAVLKGNFFIEFDENGTDVDGAYNKVVNRFAGATVVPFELAAFDIPEEYVAEMDSDEHFVKSVAPTNIKLKFTLEESYGDN